MRLSVDRINALSPYWVIQLSDMQFHFVTDNGVKYDVGFYDDEYFMPGKAYHFYIDNIDDSFAPKDIKVFQVISLILEEFFRQDASVMLYICDSRDHRESVRAKLYQRWFDNYSKKDELTLRSADMNFKGFVVYSGMILRKDNPDYTAILSAFDAFTQRVPMVYSVTQK